MRNYPWLIAVFLLLTATGCRKEIIETASTKTADVTEILSKETSNKKVTTVDGNVSKFSSTTVTLKSGEIILISKPENWNGELILYAHGYVSAYLPLAIPVEANAYVPLFTSLGYAFATTSYTQNGLAIQSGINDIINLRNTFIQQYGMPNHIYLTGGSEGGIVTTLSIEQHPALYNGGLPLCGPCGSFQGQLNYYGDFRVLFDYFFPGLLPGNVVSIPDQLIANWQTVYVPSVLQAIASNPVNTIKLLNTAHAAYTPGNDSTIAATVLGLLWYDVFATRDAVAKLNGQPYENTHTIYFGTGSIKEDIILNKKVQRFSASKTALSTVKKYYETTGKISLPVVAAHTTGDPIIPFWHLPLYQAKTIFQGTSSLFTGIPVQRYGHCTFTEAEIVQAFGLLVLKVLGQAPVNAQRLVDFSNATANGKIVKFVSN